MAREPPNFCLGGYEPPVPLLSRLWSLFPLIFDKRRCLFSSIDVVSKSNALFIDFLKDGIFLALNVNFNETTFIQHVRRESPLLAGNMFVKVFEVLTDLELGRIKGHLFPCHY